MKKRSAWPAHSSQEGLIKELLESGVPVQLTYEVRPKVDLNRKMDVEMAGKQRL